MIVFWIISLLTVVPALWAVGKALMEQRVIDALLQAGALVCIMMHFTMFWWQFHLGMEPLPMHSYACCLASVALLPLLYIYASRRIGACFVNDVLMMVGLAILGLTMRGTVNYSMGDMPDVVPPMMHVAFCMDEAYVVLKMQNVAIVLQSLFGLYKICLVLYKLRNRNYHYSRNFTHFTYVAVLGILVSIVSFIPGDDLWHGVMAYVFTILMFVIMGTGYAFLALKMDENPLVDDEGEPITLSSHYKFLELKMKFVRLMQEEKAYLEEDLNLDSVAKRIGTNRTYLSQMIKEQLNSTFATYLADCRVKAAMELLRGNNGEKMQEVAWKSGFSSVSTFNKVFKQQTGMTPSAWKNAIEERE